MQHSRISKQACGATDFKYIHATRQNHPIKTQLCFDSEQLSDHCIKSVSGQNRNSFPFSSERGPCSSCMSCLQYRAQNQVVRTLKRSFAFACSACLLLSGNTTEHKARCLFTATAAHSIESVLRGLFRSDCTLQNVFRSIAINNILH